ncbi:MAG: hypothetical protein FWF97_04350 [Alphaproteobacteria bacterium]|nr:hypothetical protein [Alphaproteobacteria bacterium]
MNKKIFILYSLFFILYAGTAFSVVVEKTAETAAIAKNLALQEARRIELAAVLARQVGASDARRLATEISASDLANLVDSTVIEDEKSSGVAYSANVTTEFDKAALNEWLGNRGIQSAAEPAVAAGRAQVMFSAAGGLNGWAAIMRASRAAGADLKITGIRGGEVSATVRDSARYAFVSEMRAAGVSVSGEYGALTINQGVGYEY